MGTGGSSALSTSRSTLQRNFFPDLWAVRDRLNGVTAGMAPRRSEPTLNPLEAVMSDGPLTRTPTGDRATGLPPRWAATCA